MPGLRTYEIKPLSRNQGQECIPQTLFAVLPNYFKTLEKCCRIRRLLNSDTANSIFPHTLLSQAIYAGTWWPLLCRIVLIEQKRKHKSKRIVSSAPQMLTSPGWVSSKGLLKMAVPPGQHTPFLKSTYGRQLYLGYEKCFSRASPPTATTVTSLPSHLYRPHPYRPGFGIPCQGSTKNCHVSLEKVLFLHSLITGTSVCSTLYQLLDPESWLDLMWLFFC